jgi:hypothetical protein
MHCFDSKLAFDLLGERQAAAIASDQRRPFENSRMSQSTFCFFKRFELSEAVKRLERASFA